MDEDQRPFGSSYLFNADAQAILEEAPDLQVGLELVNEAYSSSNWDKPDEAKEIAAKYSQQLRYRFEDNTPLKSDETLGMAPIDIEDIPLSGSTDDEILVNQINNWEAANVEFLDGTTDGEYLTVREKLKEGIKDYSSRMRREANGKDQGWLSDKFYRAQLGLTGGIAKAVGADAYVRGLQESTDPSRDDDLSSAFASGAGSVVGAVGAGAAGFAVAGPPGAYAGTSLYMGASGAGEVRETYEQSLARTGDSNRALIAGAIETGSQALQTVVGGKVFGGASKQIAGQIWKGATEAVAGGVARTALTSGLAEGTSEATGNVISNYADKYGTQNPDIDIFDGTGTNFLVGAVFGSAAGSVEAIGSRSNPTVAQGVNPVTGVTDPIQTGVVGAPVDVEATQVLRDKAVDNVTQATDVPPAPDPIGDFKTEDGSTYKVTPEGSTSRYKSATEEVFTPLDRTFFVPEETAVKLAKLREAQTPDGKPVQIITDGENLIVKGDFINEDLSVSPSPTGRSITVIEAGANPESGSYPVEVNRPKNLNGNNVENRSHIGRKIVEVTPKPETTESGGSAGAAGSKERRLGLRLKVSDALNEDIQALFGDEELGYSRYMEQPNRQVTNRSSDYIAKNGLQSVLEEVLSLDDNVTSADAIETSRQLMTELNNSYNAATKEGNTDAALRIADMADQVGNKAATMLTNAGQAVQIAKLWSSLDPNMRANALLAKLRKSAIASAATELNESPQEVAKAAGRVQEVDKQIAQLENEGRSRAPVKEGVQPNPEEGLSTEQKGKLNDLRERKKALEKTTNVLSKKREERLAAAPKEQIDKIKKLMEVSKRVSGSDQLRLINEVLKIEDDILNKAGVTKSTVNNLHTLWQLNLLSDPSTQAVNIIGNSFQMAGNIASLLSTGVPQGNFDGLEFIKGMARAATGEGFDAFVSELQGKKTFKSSEIKLDKAGNAKGKLDTRGDFVRDAPPWVKKVGLNRMGYVFRALSAADAMFYRMNQEGMAQVIAFNEAKKAGSTDASIQTEVANRLFNSEENWNSAMKEAESDANVLKEIGIERTPRDIRLRAAEIIEGKRNAESRAEVQRFAERATFTNTPTGLVGGIVKGMQHINNVPISFRGVEIRPFKYIFPFMNVAGNILNANLDYTPVGAVRALDPKATGLERRTAAGKFMVGSMLTATAYGIAREFLDDDDPLFAVYGKGPADPAKKKTLQNAGWKPYSVKIGENYFRYSETPFGLMLGAMGSWMDQERWNKAYAKQSGSAAINTIIGGMGGSFVDNSFLKNISDFVKVLSGDEGVDFTNVLVTNPSKGFIPAVGTLRAISKLIEDPIDTNNNFYAKMVSGVPVVQGIGTRPALNSFGEPVERTFEDRLSFIGRFYSNRTDDPAWRWLTENGYSITDPDLAIPTKGTSVAAKRTANLGAVFAGVLTPDEKYKLTEASGPAIKQKVLEYSKRYGTRGFQEETQKALNKEISAIRNRTKQDLFLR